MANGQNPFEPIQRALTGLQQSRQFQQQQQFKISQEQASASRANMLSNFLGNTDLATTSAGEILKNAAAISGNTSLLLPLANQVAKDQAFKQQQVAIQEQQAGTQRAGEILSRFAAGGFERGQESAQVSAELTQAGFPNLAKSFFKAAEPFKAEERLALEARVPAVERAKVTKAFKDPDPVPSGFAGIFTPESIDRFQQTSPRQGKRKHAELDFLPGFGAARAKGQRPANLQDLTEDERDLIGENTEKAIRKHPDFKRLLEKGKGKKPDTFLGIPVIDYFKDDFTVEDFIDKVEGLPEFKANELPADLLNLLDLAFLARNGGDLIQKFIASGQIDPSVFESLAPSGRPIEGQQAAPPAQQQAPAQQQQTDLTGSTPEQIKAALQSGQITREQAIEALRNR